LLKAVIAGIFLLVNYGLRLRAAEPLNTTSAHEPKDSPSYVWVVKGIVEDHSLPAKDVSDAFGKNVSRQFAVYEVEFPAFKHAILVDPKSMVVEVDRVGTNERFTLSVPDLRREVLRFRNRPAVTQALIRNLPPRIVRFFANGQESPRTSGSRVKDIQVFAGVNKSQQYALEMQFLADGYFRSASRSHSAGASHEPWIKVSPAAESRLLVFVPRKILLHQRQSGENEIFEPKRIQIAVRAACPFCWGSE
jgi:hypothetical protein